MGMKLEFSELIEVLLTHIKNFSHILIKIK